MKRYSSDLINNGSYIAIFCYFEPIDCTTPEERLSFVRILFADSSLYCLPLRNPVNPFQEMRELADLLFRKSTALPVLDPRPRADISNAVLSLALAGKILPRFARVLAAQSNLEHAIHSQRLIGIALNGIRDLLRGSSFEVVHLALIRRARAVPEEQPLQRLALLQLVRETENVVLVILALQIQEFRTGLMHWERRRDGIVDDHGNAAIGVDSQKIVGLLLVRADVDGIKGILRAVLERQFLKEDLHFLAVRS
jgi:hypothetical protein